MKKEVLHLARVSVDDPEFGGLADASFCLYQGETVMLAGLLNSGRITLLRLLSGEVSSYSGTVYVLGRETSLCDNSNVRSSRIAFIGNTPRLFENISFYENIYLSKGYERMFSIFKPNHDDREMKKWMEELNIDFSHRPLNELSRFMKIKLEILKAIAGDARIIIFAQLLIFCSDEETKELNRMIQSLNRHGIAVILEGGDYFHAFEDTISRCIVVRNRMVTTTLYKDCNGIFDEDKIRHAIVGRSFDKRYISSENAANDTSETPFLKIHIKKRETDIGLHQSSLIGIYDADTAIPQTVEGLIGSFGDIIDVYVDGKPFCPNSIAELAKAGVAVISKELSDEPVFYNLSPVENVCILAHKRFGKKFFYNKRLSEYLFDVVVGKYRILRHCAELKDRKTCYYLPYERQYELMLAKWLAINPRVLLIYGPLGNTDTKNHEKFKELQSKLIQDGKAVIIVSSDFDYLESVCAEIYQM